MVTTSCGSSKTSTATSSNGPTSLVATDDRNSRKDRRGEYDSNFLGKCKASVSATVIGHNIHALQSPKGTSLMPPSSNVNTQPHNASGSRMKSTSRTNVTATVIGCNNHKALRSPGPGTSTVLPSSDAPTHNTSISARNESASGISMKNKSNVTARVIGCNNNHPLHSPGATSTVLPSSSVPTQNTSDKSSTRNGNASESNLNPRSKTNLTATVVGRKNYCVFHSLGGTRTELLSSHAPTQNTSDKNSTTGNNFMTKSSVTATVINGNTNHVLHSPGDTKSHSSNYPTPEITDCNSDSQASGNSSTKTSTSVATKNFYGNSSSNKSKCALPVGSPSQNQNSLITLKQEMAILQGQPLDADVIDIAQKLLLKQFPKVGGLQSTYLYQVNKFSKTDGIQIHHTGMFHWVTTTTVKCAKPCRVRVMDSKWSGRLTRDMEIQIAQIYGDGKPSSTLRYELCPVQQQRGDKDCGLFAIAYATEVAYGGDPPVVSYQQSQMRKHLVACFNEGELRPFPRANKAASICSREIRCLKTYCCGLPESYSNMIECERCFNWYHFNCVGVSSKRKMDNISWVCKSCSTHKKQKLVK